MLYSNLQCVAFSVDELSQCYTILTFIKYFMCHVKINQKKITTCVIRNEPMIANLRVSVAHSTNSDFLLLTDTDGLSQFLSCSFPACIPITDKPSFNIVSSSNGRKGMITADHHQNDAKNPSKSDKIEDECSAIKER